MWLRANQPRTRAGASAGYLERLGRLLRRRWLVNIDPSEVRTTYWLASERVRSGQYVPPSVRALLKRLDFEIRHGLSPTRHDGSKFDSGTPRLTHGSQEFIGSRVVCEALGRSPRWVQRHATDLGGRLVGGRDVFVAAAVRAYAPYLEGE